MGKNEEDFVKNLKKIRVVNSSFIIATKELRTARTGTKFIDVNLSDKTGMMIGRIFSDDASKYYETIHEGACYQVQGDVQEYPRNSGKFTLKINSMQKLTEKEYDLEDYIRISPRETQTMIDEIVTTIKGIENPFLKQLLESFFFQDQEFRDEFIQCPAAKTHHHNYIEGLLEHTVGVLTICKTTCQVHPELNKDLLYTGAILHDIGKIRCYDYNMVSIEKSEEGQLLDHIPITETMIDARGADVISRIVYKNTATGKITEQNCIKQMLQVRHLIVSHHGDVKNGWGSTVDPKTPEAVALHHADNLDAKVKGIIQKQ